MQSDPEPIMPVIAPCYGRCWEQVQLSCLPHSDRKDSSVLGYNDKLRRWICHDRIYGTYSVSGRPMSFPWWHLRSDSGIPIPMTSRTWAIKSRLSYWSLLRSLYDQGPVKCHSTSSTVLLRIVDIDRRIHFDVLLQHVSNIHKPILFHYSKMIKYNIDDYRFVFQLN